MKQKEKCLNSDCRISVKRKLDHLIVVPFEGVDDETRRLFLYFLYNAPDIESAHSKSISRDEHGSVFCAMMESRHYKYCKFCNSNASIEKELEKGYLSGNDICLKCKRYVCKKKKPQCQNDSETDLDCFLRHIRNSIAHGRVMYDHAGNSIHIVFEDKNPSGKISARIVCTRADLKWWKQLLSNPKNYGR